MSEAGTRRDASAASGRRVWGVALWVLRVLLAVQFAFAGVLKVVGDPTMVEMFATIGVGQWFRYLVGVLEIAGAVGVLIPRLSGLAALGLVCLMIGATTTNVFVLGASPLAPLVALLMGAVVAWGRRPRTKELPGGPGR